jgi:hypothetical protein
MKKYFLLLFLLLNTVFIFGQNKHDTSIERPDLTNFSKVSIELAADVYIRQSDSFRCRINGSESNLEEVKAAVKSQMV